MMESKPQKSNSETGIKTSQLEFCKRTNALAGGSVFLLTLTSNLFAEFTKSDEPVLIKETMLYIPLVDLLKMINGSCPLFSPVDNLLFLPTEKVPIHY